MKYTTFFIPICLVLFLAGCSDCVECKVTYADNGEEAINEYCGEQALEEAESVTQAQETQGTIESGWSCY